MEASLPNTAMLFRPIPVRFVTTKTQGCCVGGSRGGGLFGVFVDLALPIRKRTDELWAWRLSCFVEPVFES